MTVKEGGDPSMMPAGEQRPFPATIEFPYLVCSYCKQSLFSRFLSAEHFLVEHSVVNEFVIEMGFPISFCPNNAKRWVGRYDKWFEGLTEI